MELYADFSWARLARIGNIADLKLIEASWGPDDDGFLIWHGSSNLATRCRANKRTALRLQVTYRSSIEWA
jgi:hypothetical protein